MQFIAPVWGWISGGLGALGGAAAGVSAGTWIQLGATALSAYSQYSAGLAEKREAEATARREEEGARQEVIRGKQTENAIMDRLMDTLAAQRVAFAGAGVDPFSGSASAIQGETLQRGERAASIERDNAAVAYFTRRQTALALRKRGKAAGLSGAIGAVGTMAGGVGDAMTRGA